MAIRTRKLLSGEKRYDVRYGNHNNRTKTFKTWKAANDFEKGLNRKPWKRRDQRQKQVIPQWGFV